VTGLGHLLLIVVAAATATEAVPGPKPVEIQLEGPEGCPEANAFFGFLRSRTSRVRRAEAGEPRTTLQVRLSRVHGNVLGELRVVDDRGGTDTRRVQGVGCDEVVQALSLTAALVLDPTALLTAPSAATGASPDAAGAAQSPEDAPSPPQEAMPEPLVTVASPSVSASRPIPGYEFGAGPVAMTVLSGEMSAGIAVAVRKTFGQEGVLTPTLGLALAYMRNDVLQSPQAAQTALAAMAVSLCPVRLVASILTVQPCALVLGGWLSASGRQLTRVSTVDRSWLSAGGLLRAALLLGHGLSLELEGGISAPLLKRRFYVTEPRNIVAETPAISPIVGIGLTYRL
jgi:hypothetical protein